jgi:hypothetical protein
MSESTTTESSDFEEVDQPPPRKKMKTLPEKDSSEGDEKEIDDIIAPFTSVKKTEADYGKFAKSMLVSTYILLYITIIIYLKIVVGVLTCSHSHLVLCEIFMKI